MRPLSHRLYAIAAIALAAVIFVGLNIAVDAAITTARLDLTENGRFTLAPGTRHIIASLQEPIVLKFYYSKKVAADYAKTRAYADRVRDMLEEYASLSHGKIVLEEVDPQPYTPAEDEATADGLSAAPTDSGDNVYFGLVGTNRIDGKEVIAYFTPEREPLLEYDLSSLVYRLATPKKPKLAILTTLPLDSGIGGMQAVMQGTAQPFAVYQELAQTYDIQMLEPNFTSIPADADVLMVVQPGALNEQQNFAIDQFVLKGGRALIFVDPDSQLAASAGGDDPQMAPPASSSLPRLFQAWGLGFYADKVIGDLKLAQRVQASQSGEAVRYPVWLHLGTDQVDARDPVTANIQVLNLATAGALFPRKDATTHFETLAASSAQAALLDSEQVRMNRRPQDLMDAITPSGKPFAIAARLSGPAKTAFPDAGIDALKSAKNIDVVVMADTDLFDNKFWVRLGSLYGKRVAAPFADNGAFVMNAVENLMGSSDLISLRTRATNDRPFTVVRNLQADASAQYQQEAQALQLRLTDAEQHLHDLQQGQGGKADAIALTPQQQAEIERFKRELIQTREQLREVQHNLRKDIDLLGSVLAFLNIALVPLLVAAIAVLLAALRRRRRARAIRL